MNTKILLQVRLNMARAIFDRDVKVDQPALPPLPPRVRRAHDIMPSGSAAMGASNQSRPEPAEKKSQSHADTGPVSSTSAPTSSAAGISSPSIVSPAIPGFSAEQLAVFRSMSQAQIDAILAAFAPAGASAQSITVAQSLRNMLQGHPSS